MRVGFENPSDDFLDHSPGLYRRLTVMSHAKAQTLEIRESNGAGEKKKGWEKEVLHVEDRRLQRSGCQAPDNASRFRGNPLGTSLEPSRVL